MADDRKSVARPPLSDAALAFAAQLRRAPAIRPAGAGGRLIMALDATMSRQPSWDAAQKAQNEMFRAAAEAGDLKAQLVSFRGLADFDVRPWTSDPQAMIRAMEGYACQGGRTQIRRVLRHAAKEAKGGALKAVVFVGDQCEEDADAVCVAAGELAIAGAPVFMFQEGRDGRVEALYREIARLTRGAYRRFDAGSADALRDLLKAVAVFAAGGRAALERHARKAGGEALALVRQIEGGGR